MLQAKDEMQLGLEKFNNFRDVRKIIISGH